MPEFLNKKFSDSADMCKNILNKTGVALLPGSDFGFDKKKLIVRLSFTDFDGKKFISEIKKNKDIDFNLIKIFAPNIVEGTKRLKEWSESV